MSKDRKPYLLLILCAMLSLAATACFRDSAEGIGEQPVAGPLSSPTQTGTQNATATPTLAAASVNQISTEPAPDTFALTATELIGRLTRDAAMMLTTQAFEAGIGATETPLPTATREPLPTPLPVTRATLVPGADCIHQIRAGDTMYLLSTAYGVSVEAIANANNIADPSRIQVDQRVTIPRCGTTGFIPPPTATPPVTSVPEAVPSTEQAEAVVATDGEDDGSASAAVQEAQAKILSNAQINIPSSTPVQSAEIPAAGSRTYTLRQYDTLYDIAQQFDTTIDEIAALNNITNIDDIKIGDVLLIP